MPKIIKDVDAKLLAAGRDLLLNGGYEKFTMREVAKACGIGLGTAYNYFPSKEYFAAKIILQDWQSVEKEMEEAVKAASTPEEQTKVLFTYLKRFAAMYQNVWDQYVGQSHTSGGVLKYHDMFVKKLCAISGLSWFVVECVLHFVTLKDVRYEDIEDNLKKLL